jgi:hypothetical protein
MTSNDGRHSSNDTGYVRGTTAWSHAIVQKKVINHDRGGTFVMCGWDTCELPGYENNKCVVHEGVNGNVRDITYIFCTERHRQYWINSVRDCNNLPAGYARSIL